MYIHTITNAHTLPTHSYDEALADFESASKLNHALPSPHVCAGLIHMKKKRSELAKAIQCFTSAIFVDPTCLRAYLCRAEAYKKGRRVRQCGVGGERRLGGEGRGRGVKRGR